MRYMMIVKASRDSEAGVMPKEELFAQMASFTATARAGVLVDASGLKASTRVRASASQATSAR